MKEKRLSKTILCNRNPKQEGLNADNSIDILENIQSGIILCNYDVVAKTSEVTYINRAWTALSGYTMEQLQAEKGGNPEALILAEDLERVKAEFEQQREQGAPYEILFRILHRSGALRWVIAKSTIRPRPDGGMRIQDIITEVTELKEREERMAILAQIDRGAATRSPLPC